jgi:hypothetical protein
MVLFCLYTPIKDWKGRLKASGTRSYLRIQFLDGGKRRNREKGCAKWHE